MSHCAALASMAGAQFEQHFSALQIEAGFVGQLHAERKAVSLILRGQAEVQARAQRLFLDQYARSYRCEDAQFFQNEVDGQGAIHGFVGLAGAGMFQSVARSEEHTSELQSLMRSSYAVFCLK